MPLSAAAEHGNKTRKGTDLKSCLIHKTMGCMFKTQTTTGSVPGSSSAWPVITCTGKGTHPEGSINPRGSQCPGTRAPLAPHGTTGTPWHHWHPMASLLQQAGPQGAPGRAKPNQFQTKPASPAVPNTAPSSQPCRSEDHTAL